MSCKHFPWQLTYEIYNQNGKKLLTFYIIIKKQLKRQLIFK